MNTGENNSVMLV